MVRKAEVEDRIFIDEAEGFLLSHALFSPPRTWPPLPPDQPTQAERLQKGAKKMDWDTQMAAAAEASTVAATGAGPAGRCSPSQAKGRKASTGMGDWFEIDQPAAGPSGTDGTVARHDGYDEAEDSQERCVICLMALRDRTVVGVCGHEFCFECIGVWANQSRRCPLCSADMAPFLLHDLDNPVPTKFYLPPLPTRKFPPLTLTLGPSAAGPSRRVTSNQMSDTPEGADQEEVDELDKQVERRKEIYRHGLFVKHIPANTTTGFKPNPTPRQIADTPLLIQRATAFLRRELRIWGMADVEYLVIYVLNLLKAIDMRSEPFIRLLKDILEPDSWGMGGAHQHATTRSHTSANANGNAQMLSSGQRQSQGQQRVRPDVHAQQHAQYPHAAEHLAHELYSWLRSPYRELWRWDAMAQYDPIPDPATTAQRADAADEPVSVPSIQAKEAPAPRRSDSPCLSPYSPHSRSRSRSLSLSSYSSGSYSRSSSPRSPRSARDPTQRDTFIPAAREGERRWDEPDIWLDPEWEREQAQRQAKREKKERERMERMEAKFNRREEWEDRERAKRARLISEHAQQQEGHRHGLPVPVAVPIRALHGHGATVHSIGMRAWGEREAVGVELLPDQAAVRQLRDQDEAYEKTLEPRDRRQIENHQEGLHIRGRSSFGQEAGVGTGEGRKLTLAERLAKAKAERDGQQAAGASASQTMHRALSEIPVNLPSNPADINVEDLLSSSPTSDELIQLQDIPANDAIDAARMPGTLSAPAKAFIPTPYLTSTTTTAITTSTSETVLQRIARARARLRLRLKLESERACLRHNIAESRAQTLRAKLLEAKIARQAGETDVQLRKMDKLERDREVRRRLMVIKMMGAETEGERRARELKERLARAKKGNVGRKEGVSSVRVEEVTMRDGMEEERGYAYRYPQQGFPSGVHPYDTVSPVHTDSYQTIDVDGTESPVNQEAKAGPPNTPKELAQVAKTETKEKTAEVKAKEEARRAKILRNLLLERKRAKGGAAPGSASPSGETHGSAAVASDAAVAAPGHAEEAVRTSTASVGVADGSKGTMTEPLEPQVKSRDEGEVEAEETTRDMGMVDRAVGAVEDEWELEPDAVI